MDKMTLGKIEKDIPIPLYYQINDIMLKKIDSKEFLPHQKIPTEEELAVIFEVSRMTVRQAIIKLVNDGKLYRKRGHGTFVAEPKIERKVARLTSMTVDMEEAGLKPGSIILQKNVVNPVEEDKHILKLNPEDKVVEIIRLRLANDQPIAIGRGIIPVKICPSLVEENLDNVVSLTQFIEEKCGIKIAYADQKIQAVNADLQQSKLLKIKKGTSLLHLYRVFYSNDHTPIGVFVSSYRGDRYVFSSTLYR